LDCRDYLHEICESKRLADEGGTLL
jgi:hypothetical protein